MRRIGTRFKQGFWQGKAPTRTQTRTYTRDIGMKARAVDTVTFAAPGSATFNTAANSNNYVVGQRVKIGPTNLNNGVQQITAIAAGVLTLAEGVKAEGPIANVEIRTI